MDAGGTLDVQDGTFDIGTAGKSLTINGSATISGGIAFVKDLSGSGTLSMTGGLLKVSHDYKPATPANFDCSGGGTVEFTGNAGGGAFGTAGTYKFNDVVVDAAATSGIGFNKNATNIISIAGNLNIIAGGVVNLPNNTSSTTNSLQLNGTYQDVGTWGGSASSATNTNSTYFGTSSTGLITVIVGGLPVELTTFSGSVNGNTVTLEWSTETEINNYGFDVERNSSSGWSKIGFVAGSGNSNSPKNYSYIDQPNAGSSFSYRLKQIDIGGVYKYYDAINVSLSGSDKAQLMQNSPNPFNPSTSIKFYVPETMDVTIKIYDLLGKEVTTLINNQATAGYHVVYWNGRDSNGRTASSGVYICKLMAGNFAETKKMNLLK